MFLNVESWVQGFCIQNDRKNAPPPPPPQKKKRKKRNLTLDSLKLPPSYNKLKRWQFFFFFWGGVGEGEGGVNCIFPQKGSIFIIFNYNSNARIKKKR
jgi:hypothetical protein